MSESDVDAVVQASFTVLDTLTRAAGRHDLSLTQLRLLGILRDRTPTMAALAERLGLDKSSVSGLIDRAERRGLVARQPSSDDARVTTVALTTAGRELAAELTTTVGAGVEALLDKLPRDERARVLELARAYAR